MEMDEGTAKLFKEWRALYGEAVDGDQSIECINLQKCGNRVEGDSPNIVIVCWECYQQGTR